VSSAWCFWMCSVVCNCLGLNGLVTLQTPVIPCCTRDTR
jgi:hypothetical protein